MAICWYSWQPSTICHLRTTIFPWDRQVVAKWHLNMLIINVSFQSISMCFSYPQRLELPSSYLYTLLSTLIFKSILITSILWNIYWLLIIACSWKDPTLLYIWALYEHLSAICSQNNVHTLNLMPIWWCAPENLQACDIWELATLIPLTSTRQNHQSMLIINTPFF